MVNTRSSIKRFTTIWQKAHREYNKKPSQQKGLAKNWQMKCNIIFVRYSAAVSTGCYKFSDRINNELFIFNKQQFQTYVFQIPVFAKPRR